MTAQVNCACSGCLPLEGGSGRTITASKTLFAMHALYGHGPEDQTCGHCQHLSEYQPGNAKFFKCNLYGPTRSSASDWRKKWEACGAFKP